MKQRIRTTFRLLKALATDERLPAPIRWLIGVSLAVKAVPVPDFGVDEVGLLIAFGLLATVYRKRFDEILADVRAKEDNRGRQEEGQPDTPKADLVTET